ncbi:hypothetical protein AAL_01646 [Moelleriella libera RCEF 2490]|uniref:Uncharacterized protein n=1 Tax=Moelleriella libera RCEF 2490 TaxID=1081109 RepID=A0A166UBS3_9HYPO|nr:hypothetical protein AAL_01646 [Moelleriella libera RCEF 2490]
MSQGRALMIATAGAAAIGGAFYATRGSKSSAQARKDAADSKRDLGLGGVGVGGNVLTGGPESGPPRPDKDPQRSTKTTAESRDKLPSGGLGGGEGAGGSSARKTDLS